MSVRTDGSPSTSPLRPPRYGAARQTGRPETAKPAPCLLLTHDACRSLLPSCRMRPVAHQQHKLLALLAEVQTQARAWSETARLCLAPALELHLKGPQTTLWGPRGLLTPLTQNLTNSRQQDMSSKRQTGRLGPEGVAQAQSGARAQNSTFHVTVAACSTGLPRKGSPAP